MRIGVVYRILIRILINIAAQLRLKRINLNYIHITYALSGVYNEILSLKP